MFTFNDWGFYQFIIGIIALAVTILIFILGKIKNKKDFGYYITDSIPLISDDFGLESLRVLYNNKLVKDSFIRKFYFENNGKEFIDSDDFIEPINISTETSVKIIDAVISSTSPQNLKPTISINNSKVLVNPLLLNNGDSFIIILISEGELLNPLIGGRIKGIREFKNLNKKYIKISVKLFYFMLGILSYSVFSLLIQVLLYFIL